MRMSENVAKNHTINYLSEYNKIHNTSNSVYKFYKF